MILRYRSPAEHELVLELWEEHIGLEVFENSCEVHPTAETEPDGILQENSTNGYPRGCDGNVNGKKPLYSA